MRATTNLIITRRTLCVLSDDVQHHQIQSTVCVEVPTTLAHTGTRATTNLRHSQCLLVHAKAVMTNIMQCVTAVVLVAAA